MLWILLGVWVVSFVFCMACLLYDPATNRKLQDEATFVATILLVLAFGPVVALTFIASIIADSIKSRKKGKSNV